MDVTYFGDWGLLVAIDPNAIAELGENTVLYYATVNGTERTVDYEPADIAATWLLLKNLQRRRGCTFKKHFWTSVIFSWTPAGSPLATQLAVIQVNKFEIYWRLMASDNLFMI